MHFYDHNHEEYENIASSENFSNIMRFRCMHWTDTILPEAKHIHTLFGWNWWISNDDVKHEVK